jgi:hypothetical protein
VCRIRARQPFCERIARSIRKFSIGRLACKPLEKGGHRVLEVTMSLWQKLFSRNSEPRQRVRVCVECGMPIAEHKEWCSILRTQREYDAKAAAASASKAQ